MIPFARLTCSLISSSDIIPRAAMMIDLATTTTTTTTTTTHQSPHRWERPAPTWRFVPRAARTAASAFPGPSSCSRRPRRSSYSPCRQCSSRRTRPGYRRRPRSSRTSSRAGRSASSHRCVFFLVRPIENREVLGAEFLSYLFLGYYEEVHRSYSSRTKQQPP